MSCWREQKVLRLPMSAVGVEDLDAWYEFEQQHEDQFHWDPGCFAPALCTKRNGVYLDYFLEDNAPVNHRLDGPTARPLTAAERSAYLPVFRSLFPFFTMELMEHVHYCHFVWYDGADAPECY